MTTRIRCALLLVTLAAAATPAGAQQQRAVQERRAELEARVLAEFMARVAQQSDMSETQQVQVRAILEESAARHRERTVAAMRLRRALVEAVQNAATPEAEFMRIMREIESLRADEQDAWQADQRAIAGVLTPRQRAIFSVRWLDFQDRVRAVMGARERRIRGTPDGPPG